MPPYFNSIASLSKLSFVSLLTLVYSLRVRLYQSHVWVLPCLLNLFRNMSLSSIAFLQCSRQAISSYSFFYFTLKPLYIFIRTIFIYVTRLNILCIYISLSFLGSSLFARKMLSVHGNVVFWNSSPLCNAPCTCLVIRSHIFEF